MPAGYERCQDHGGEQRRALGLQTGQGNPVPARMLAQRTIRGVDQAHREHYEEGGQGVEGQRRDARPGCDVEPRSDQVDTKRESYGHHVPVPPHAPADYPGAELAQPREALGDGDHDEGGQERPGRQEAHALDRQESPRDRVGQYEERDDRVSSDRRHRAPSSLPPENGGMSLAAMMPPKDPRCISNAGLFTEARRRGVLGSSYPGTRIEPTRPAHQAAYPSSWPRSQDHCNLGRWIDMGSAASNSFYGDDGERKSVCCWYTERRPSLCPCSPAFGEVVFYELRLCRVLGSTHSPGPTPMST